jgi:WD40 repeat protein
MTTPSRPLTILLIGVTLAAGGAAAFFFWPRPANPPPRHPDPDQAGRDRRDLDRPGRDRRDQDHPRRDTREPDREEVTEPDPFPPGKGVDFREAAWHPHGVFTISGTHAALWDPDTGKQLRRWRHSAAAPSHALDGSPVSADGRRIVLLDVEPKPGRIGRVVSTSGKGAEVVLTAVEKGGPFRFVSWSPDGGRLLFLGAGEVLHLWDAASGKFVGPLRGEKAPEMQYLSTGDLRERWTFGAEGSETGREISYGNYRNTMPPRAWNRALWSADGAFLLTLAGREEIGVLDTPDEVVTVTTVWDGRTGRRLNALTVPRRRYSQAAFSPRGNRLAELTLDVPTAVRYVTRLELQGDRDVLTGTLRVRDPATGAALHRLEGGYAPYLFAWSPEGRRLVVVGAEGGRTREVACWDVETGETVWTYSLPEFQGLVRALAFSPDGKQLALTSTTTLGEYEHQAFVQVWDAAEGQPRWGGTVGKDTLLWKAILLTPVSWSPDGKSLAAGPHVWDVGRRAAAFSVERPAIKLEPPERSQRKHSWSGGPLRLRWAPDGRRVAAWWQGSSPLSWPATTPLAFWDTTTGKRVRQFPEEP